MNDFKEVIASTKAQIGENVEFKGPNGKKGRTRHNAGHTAGDILGWDYIFREGDEICYSFHAAQPPLIGMTQPQADTMSPLALGEYLYL